MSKTYLKKIKFYTRQLHSLELVYNNALFEAWTMSSTCETALQICSIGHRNICTSESFHTSIQKLFSTTEVQISAPIPCWGNPSSIVTSRLVFLTDALIGALSNGQIERRFITSH